MAVDPIAERNEAVKDWLSDRDYLKPYHDGIGPDLAFSWDQVHWSKPDSRDPQRIQPSDPSLTNVIRYKASEIFRGAQNADVIPVDSEGDPALAPVVKSLISQWENDPENLVLEALEEVLIGGLATGAWCAEMGFDPACGPFGEVYLESLDPRRYFPQAGFKPNKRRRYITVMKSMTPDEIEAMADQGWTDTAGCPTDHDARQANSAGFSDQMPAPGHSETQFATVLMRWERYSNRKYKRTEYRRLAPDDRYMQCNDCQMKGMRQGVLGTKLPESGVPCPVCGGTNTQRIDATAVSPEVDRYMKGRRLRVIAPWANRTLYDDSWPWEKLTVFPVTMWTPYCHPAKLIPNGDTEYYRPLVCTLDAMWRLGYEQQRKAHGMVLAPKEGLEDAYGEDPAFSDYQDYIYYDATKLMGLGPNAIQWFQPPGLNSMWAPFVAALQSVFASTKGTGDIPFPADRSRDVAAEALQLMVETGDRAIDQHIRRFQRFLSLTKTGIFQIMQSTYSDARAVYVLGTNGKAEIQQVRAAALPGYDVVVTNEPNIRAGALDDVKAYQAVAAAPPAWRPLIARKIGMSPLELQQVTIAEQQQQAQAQAEAQAQAQQQPAMPDMGGGPGPVGMPPPKGNGQPAAMPA